MSKITFRADDELVRRIETLDASKSEVMRDALRDYLDARESEHDGGRDGQSGGTLDDVVTERIDALITERLGGRLQGRAQRPMQRRTQDINVNVTLDGAQSQPRHEHDTEPRAIEQRTSDTSDASPPDGAQACAQCGEHVEKDHVYCPNCGEKASHRLFCDCGDEIRTDWAFCPSCGRRTPSADVLERS